MRTMTGVLLALALATPALAHDDATLDAMPSPNGGQVRMSGPYHLELVLGDNEVSVYLTDHADTPVPSEGVGGNVIIMSGERVTIPVAPTGDNKVTGQGTFEKRPDMKAIASLNFPDGNTRQARFTPGTRVGTDQSAAVDPATDDDHAHHHH